LALVLGAQHAADLGVERGRGLWSRRGGGSLAELSAATAAAEAASRSGVVAPVVAAAAAATATAASASARRAARLRHSGRAGGCRFARREIVPGSGADWLADVARFDLRVDDVRIGSRHVERDAAIRAGREATARQLRPRPAGVRALPDRAAR